MSIVEITPNQSLNGYVVIPGDKSISHRAIFMSGLIDGSCKISNLNLGQDVLNTLNFIKSLGVELTQRGEKSFQLNFDRKYSNGPIKSWCGNSGTMARLGLGFVSGLGVKVEFDGDDSLRTRPMDRVIEPLSQMGANFELNNGSNLPITAVPADLHGISFLGKRPSAQVKSSILLAGLNATGRTVVSEVKPTRKHTEELFSLANVPFETVKSDSRYTVSIEGPIIPIGFELNIPGDPSQAAFFIAGALLCHKSRIRIENVYLGQERTGFLEVLKRMGANILIEPDVQSTIPVGAVEATSSELVATDIFAGEVADLIDEIPILAACAAMAEGVSRFNGLSELRVKETDRIVTVSEMLAGFGIKVSVVGDDLIIYGGSLSKKNSLEIQSCFDHRIAMSAAILALSLNEFDGNVKIHDFECVETSYIGFLEDLAGLGAVNE